MIIETLLVCFTLYTIVDLILDYKKERPQNNCKHNFSIINTCNSDINSYWLSTCKICGKQKKHKF